MRNTLLERGIRPESLPPAEDVKKVERRLASEEKKSLKNRVDELEKLECESIFKSLGLTMSEAVRLFIRQVNTVKGLPFEMKLNATAATEHDRWFREQVESVLAKVNKPDRVSASHDDVGTRLKSKQAALHKKAV